MRPLADSRIACAAWGDPDTCCPLFDPDAGRCTQPAGGCYGSILAQALASPERLALFLQFHNPTEEVHHVC